MKRLLLAGLFLSMIGTSAAFADFGIGGVILVDGDTTETNLNLHGGLSLGFIDKKKPLIWNINVGSFSLLETFPLKSNITLTTTLEYHAVAVNGGEWFQFYLTPGLGAQVGFISTKSSTSGGTVNTAQVDIMKYGAGFRLGLGFKFFVGDSAEIFIQGTPEIGWQYLEQNFGGIDLDEDNRLGVHTIYWKIEGSIGTRFWF